MQLTIWKESDLKCSTPHLVTSLTVYNYIRSQISKFINTTSVKLVNCYPCNLAHLLTRVLSIEITNTTFLEPRLLLIKVSENTNIIQLHINQSRLVDVSRLAVMGNLTELSLCSNMITSVVPLQYLTKLTKLYLSNNTISSLGPLLRLTNLTTLWLDGNALVNVDVLLALVNLQELSLNHNNIKVISMASLANLTRLYICHNQLTHIVSLPRSLLVLHITSNWITDLTCLVNCPKLDTLDCGFNQIYDPSQLMRPTLTQLYANHNLMNDPSMLLNLADLVAWNFDGNPNCIVIDDDVGYDW